MLEPVLLNRSEIDSGRWDHLVADSVNFTFYGFSWYLDIVSESWQALVWPSKDDYQFIMPLPVKKRLGVPVIYQPHFCQFLGIYSTSAINSDIIKTFLQSCLSHFFYISSYCFHPDLSELIRPILRQFPEVTFIEQYTFWKFLPRNHPYNADRKRNLQRGTEWNWTVEDGDNIGKLTSLFSLYHSGNIEGGVSEQSYETLYRLTKEFWLHGNVTLQYASLAGEVHAGILVFRYGNYSVYIFNAADEKGRKGNARTVMLNSYFQNHGEACLLFDFESAQQPHIHAFYRSFGGVDAQFYSITKSRLRFPFNHFQSVRRQLIRTRRALLSILCKT